MKHLSNLIKKIEIDIRSSNLISKENYILLAELPEWDYRIIQDAILRIRMAISKNDMNFVYKLYQNQKDSSFYKDQNHKKVDLIIAALRRDQNDTSLTDAYNRLYIPNNIKHDIFEIWGLQVTEARNLAVKEALKRGAKYLLFIDDDIVAPNNALVKLLKLAQLYPEKLAWAGQYYKKIEPLDSAHDLAVKDNKLNKDNNLFELDLCAMGFTLIDIETICKKVPLPLFWEFGAEDGYWSMGEDAFFTNNILEYFNTKPILDNSIKLLHYDKIWKRSYGKRDTEVTYATAWIEDLDHFERCRVPNKFPKVSIAIPTREKESPVGANLQKLPILRGYQTEVITISGLPVDQARTNLVQQALDNNSNYILFIDDDIVPPIDGFVRLLEHIENGYLNSETNEIEKIDIISGDYLLKGIPEHSVHLQLNKDGIITELNRMKDFNGKVQNNQLYKSDWLIGLGFCLIDLDLFKQARQPWFKCHTKNAHRIKDQESLNINEDAHFTELAFQNGFNVFIDPTIQCLHLDFEKKQVYSYDKNYQTNINMYAGFN